MNDMNLMDNTRGDSNPDRFIGRAELLALTSLRMPSILREERAGRFPARRQLAPGRVAWRLSEVKVWMDSRPTAEASK